MSFPKLKTSAARDWYGTSFLYRDAQGECNTLQLLADNQGAEYENRCAKVLADTESNYVFFFLLNDDGPVTPYIKHGDHLFGGAFDDSKIERYDRLFKLIHDSGKMAIPCLRSDDSPKINAQMTDPDWMQFIDAIAYRYDEYVKGWCVALEASEYWSAARCHQVAQYVKHRSARPVGIHVQRFRDSEGGIARTATYFNNPNIDFGMYEYLWHPSDGNKQSWRAVRDGGIEIMQACPGKPMILMEFNYDQTNRFHTLAASLIDTTQLYGVGNCCCKGLVNFMRSLPADMVSRVEGENIILEGAGLRVTADMATAEVRIS